TRIYSNLREQFERMGGYTYKKEYMTAVKKFGFTDSDLQKRLVEFSGGQRTKIALIRLLLSKPDVLLLDEPTNHLDLQAIEWLERYLIGYKNSCIIVSHDRMFLDKIVNVVYEVEYGETTRYSGNYSAFMVQKQQNYDKALKDSIQRKKEIDRLNALVERFRYKATKAAMVQSKIKQIQRIGDVGTPVGFDNSTFRANFQPVHETVEKAIVLSDLSFGYDRQLGHIDMTVKRGQKVGIIGQNGTGKSTLIKTVMHLIPSLGGSASFGLHAEVGYFDQTLTQSFSTLTVMEDFHNAFPLLSDTEVRSTLGSFLFTGDDVFKQICDLSGGEKVRLALCKIFKKRPNILILDEPTNHMDIIGKETLENMLSAYTGTVLTVSHDRYFINRICDRLIVFEEGNAQIFDGKYSDYELQKFASDDDSAEQKKPIVKKGKPISESTARNKRLHRIGVLESKMKVLTDKIDELKRQMGEDPAIYTDYQKIAEIENIILELTTQLEPLEEEWLSLSDED
ncbi:MAG: ABC-F family ATP-binding cassette domain-containing protein, partial [Clostridia bacterium]|nr:ABC-F family ATP-binding cassette domain-containing protein [Clostridia bacterium]